MDNKYTFYDGYFLEVDPSHPKITVYVFYNPEGKAISTYKERTEPLSWSFNKEISKEIKAHIEDIDDLKPAKARERFQNVIVEINDLVADVLVHLHDLEDNAQEIEEAEFQSRIQEGLLTLDTVESPLLWIANQIDWFTAGERINIMLAFIAYCSQVVLKNPISVIANGEAGKGKTHIIETALNLMPQEFVFSTKSATEAALFAYSEEDPYFFDGKIVNIGDMGGKNDHEEAQAFKNAMKELQSDGKLKRIKQVKDEEGNFINREYELFGYPCITYTNVPGFTPDGQELSRSIILTPRTDNDEAFVYFKRIMMQKGTPNALAIEKVQESIPVIQRMVLALRERMKDITIYNPYWSFLEKFLGRTKYLKRDIDKYDGILRAITAINGYNRDLVDVNGYKTLFTTKEDIKLFIDLLSRYHESITLNLSPGASDILDEMRELAEDNYDVYYEKGISVNDYSAVSSLNLSKGTFRIYFGELNAAGLLKVSTSEGRRYYYALVDVDLTDAASHIELSEMDRLELIDAYGLEDLSMFEADADICILDVLEGYKEPVWNKLLPKTALV